MYIDDDHDIVLEIPGLPNAIRDITRNLFLKILKGTLREPSWDDKKVIIWVDEDEFGEGNGLAACIVSPEEELVYYDPEEGVYRFDPHEVEVPKFIFIYFYTVKLETGKSIQSVDAPTAVNDILPRLTGVSGDFIMNWLQEREHKWRTRCETMPVEEFFDQLHYRYDYVHEYALRRAEAKVDPEEVEEETFMQEVEKELRKELETIRRRIMTYAGSPEKEAAIRDAARTTMLEEAMRLRRLMGTWITDLSREDERRRRHEERTR